MTSLIILLIALALAAGATWLFIRWKCPSKKDKLQQIAENAAELDEYVNVSELENLSPQEIKTKKAELNEGIKKIKEFQNKKAEELSEEEQKALNNLPALQEIQTLIQKIEKKEDLAKKVIGGWDYAWVGGAFIVVFLVIYYALGSIFKSEK